MSTGVIIVVAICLTIAVTSVYSVLKKNDKEER